MVSSGDRRRPPADVILVAESAKSSCNSASSADFSMIFRQGCHWRDLSLLCASYPSVQSKKRNQRKQNGVPSPCTLEATQMMSQMGGCRVCSLLESLLMLFLRRVGGGGDATCKDVYAQHSLCSMARALWSMVGGPNLNQENAEW